MKRILSLLLAGIIGGAVALAGAYFLLFPLVYRTTPDNFARKANYLNVSPSAAEVPGNFTEGAAKAMPAVVHISASSIGSGEGDERDPFRFFFDDNLFKNPFQDRLPQQGSGSGVIYSSDGYIITNNHVVEFAQEIEVTLFDNRKFSGEIVGFDKKTDLAVIKIEGSDLVPLEIADSDQAQVGEWVLAVGNPFDLASTVTAGIISAKGRDINLLDGNTSIETFIQTDAAVNPGNSGGALVTASGQLLGINTAIATRNGVFSGYSFAIPVNLVTRIVDDIIEFGSYQRAFLGVHIYPLDSEAAAELGVDFTQGVVIDKLEDGGSAQYAGLLPKDIIIEVNNRPIKAVPELQEIVGRAKVGDVLKLVIVRKRNEIEIPVHLKAEN